MRSEGGTPRLRLIATYLLHLIERGLIHAELLEVILRRRDDLVDDLLVDGTLESLSARSPSPRSRVLRGYLPPPGSTWPLPTNLPL
jgi:hypothetical protein